MHGPTHTSPGTGCPFRKGLLLVLVTIPLAICWSQDAAPTFSYTVAVPDPSSHAYEVRLQTSGWDRDTVVFKMPDWMPGYYQKMNYSADVAGMKATDENGRPVPISDIGNHSWQVSGAKNKDLHIAYRIQTSRQFVANSYADSLHAYLVPANTFLYADGHLDTPVSVTVEKYPGWKDCATGLESAGESSDTYFAPDFDILYDSPFLLGNLEELPSFRVQGIEHRFIGYYLGSFDKTAFMKALQAVVEASVAVIGDIPYKQYSFIAIGPGMGGIEHLNNTTFSFSGNGLDTEEGMRRMMHFLAHEYFHHYNVKRIRPLELGPFDYSQGSKTNLLWVSEGLSVYYEYLIARRAGLDSEADLLHSFEQHINGVENNPGNIHQSLVQASFQTWDEGPFGNQGKNKGKTISVYEKGPVIGLLLDLAIRHATENEQSLDDVMCLLYWQYYKAKNRGFTDAEFQQACESVAGAPLTQLFEYVYTTRPIDYATYLGYAGLKLQAAVGANGAKIYSLERQANPTALQEKILNDWLGQSEE